MCQRECPQPQIGRGIGNTAQSELDGLYALMDHGIGQAMMLLLLPLIILVILELLVALWYGSIALQEVQMACVSKSYNHT